MLGYSCVTEHYGIHAADMGAALFAAARDNNLDEVRHMLEMGADVNWKNPSTVSPTCNQGNMGL